MNPQRIWTIVRKEWAQSFRNWAPRIEVLLVPVVLTFVILKLLAYLHEMLPKERFPTMLDYYLVMFTAMPLIGAAKVAVTGMMEDKAARSLEPLLVTPLTTGELLAAKIFASVAPATLVSWLAYEIFVTGMVRAGFSESPVFGSFKGAGWRCAVFVIAPLLAVLVAAFAFLISSRMRDARRALNGCSEIAGGITLLVFAGIGFSAYKHYEITAGWLALIIAAVALLNGLMFLLCVKLFQRETILFKWK